MRWFVYVAITAKGSFYTGISTDPERRVYEHNFTRKGAKCLRGQRPITLVWKNAYPASKSAALSGEAFVKRMSRMEKLKFVLERCLISYEELDELLFGAGESRTRRSRV